MKNISFVIALSLPILAMADEPAFDDKALIVIITESGGSIGATKLYLNSKLVTRLKNNEAIVLQVPTGTHQIKFDGNGETLIPIKLDQYSVSVIKVEGKFFGDNILAGGYTAYQHDGEYNISKLPRRELDATKGELNYLTEEGATYIGQMSSDRPNGIGVLTYPNGVLIEGHVKNGLSEGQVFVKYPNGNSYTGQTRESKLHGDGIYTLADGTFISGIFKNNSPYKGEMKLSDGSLYRGNFENWKPNGSGDLYTKDGLRLSGTFKEKDFIKGDIYNQSGNIVAHFKNGKISNASSSSAAEAIGYAIKILAGAAQIYAASQRQAIINQNMLKPSMPMDKSISGYKSIMGTTYQYDMADPIDRIEYGIDVDAQLRDRMGNLNPIHGINQGIERSIGEHGAGVYE